MHLPFNFEYFYKGTKSVDDFRGAIREDVQKGKSAIYEGLLYYAKSHFLQLGNCRKRFYLGLFGTFEHLNERKVLFRESPLRKVTWEGQRPHFTTVFPHLLNTPLIEYSNIKGVFNSTYWIPKSVDLFSNSCMERFLTRVEWHQLPRSVSWYAAVYSMHSGPKLWLPLTTVNRHNCSHLDRKLSYK